MGTPSIPVNASPTPHSPALSSPSPPSTTKRLIQIWIKSPHGCFRSGEALVYYRLTKDGNPFLSDRKKTDGGACVSFHDVPLPRFEGMIEIYIQTNALKLEGSNNENVLSGFGEFSSGVCNGIIIEVDIIKSDSTETYESSSENSLQGKGVEVSAQVSGNIVVANAGTQTTVQSARQSNSSRSTITRTERLFLRQLQVTQKGLGAAKR